MLTCVAIGTAILWGGLAATTGIACCRAAWRGSWAQLGDDSMFLAIALIFTAAAAVVSLDLICQ